jgi:hypothetical protein
MASELVTPDQYPDLHTVTLTCENGTQGKFLGYVVTAGLPCTACGTTTTVNVYRGPQYGLAFDVPKNPFEVEAVHMELSWCSRHGDAGWGLVNQDGGEHAGI